MIGVGMYMYICMYVCVHKKYLNAALLAGSPPERLVEPLSRTLQTNDSIEELRGAFYTRSYFVCICIGSAGSCINFLEILVIHETSSL